jgi:flagellar basal-body rod protein FlgB
MKLGDMSFFATASRRMQWLGARQQVITQNIANADTPDYKAKEISGFDEVLKGQQTSGIAATNARHIGGANGPGNFKVDVDTGSWEQSLDGNTVVLEQQTIKAAEVSENYRLAAQLYRKGHELLTLAVTGTR